MAIEGGCGSGVVRVTAEGAAAYNRACDAGNVVNLFLGECDEAIITNSQRCRPNVSVPANYNRWVTQQVIKNLKSRGFEVEEQYQCNVGPFLFISWNYLLKD
jgi:hypothetical protein